MGSCEGDKREACWSLPILNVFLVLTRTTLRDVWCKGGQSFFTNCNKLSLENNVHKRNKEGKIKTLWKGISGRSLESGGLRRQTRANGYGNRQGQDMSGQAGQSNQLPGVLLRGNWFGPDSCDGVWKAWRNIRPWEWEKCCLPSTQSIKRRNIPFFN